jgi:hypothetical protein
VSADQLAALRADLETESRTPGATMTITKAQYAYLLACASALYRSRGTVVERLDTPGNRANLEHSPWRDMTPEQWDRARGDRPDGSADE